MSPILPVIPELDTDWHVVIAIANLLSLDLDRLPSPRQLVLDELSLVDQHRVRIITTEAVDPQEGTSRMPEPESRILDLRGT
jgi:hypothetical protein